MNDSITTELKTNQYFYRITSEKQKNNYDPDYNKIFNGLGALRNPLPSRYSLGNRLTVYLSDNIDSCIAEYAYYFLKQYLTKTDEFIYTNNLFNYSNTSKHFAFFPHHESDEFILWCMKLKYPIGNIAVINNSTATSFGIYPTFTISPSHDYLHSGAVRDVIQNKGYKGLIAPSSRDVNNNSISINNTNMGNIVVLFEDQSKNISSIEPYRIAFKLSQDNNKSFSDISRQSLNFNTCHIQIKPLSSGHFLRPPLDYFNVSRTICFNR